jgi:hypothetical protein
MYRFIATYRIDPLPTPSSSYTTGAALLAGTGFGDVNDLSEVRQPHQVHGRSALAREGCTWTLAPMGVRS